MFTLPPVPFAIAVERFATAFDPQGLRESLMVNGWDTLIGNLFDSANIITEDDDLMSSLEMFQELQPKTFRAKMTRALTDRMNSK